MLSTLKKYFRKNVSDFSQISELWDNFWLKTLDFPDEFFRDFDDFLIFFGFFRFCGATNIFLLSRFEKFRILWKATDLIRSFLRS